MCRVMRVQRSGFYAWLKQPVSSRGREDLRLLGLIRSFYAESGGLYGSPRIYKDLREFGERCGENRVARLMRQDGIRAQRGYKRPRHKAGPAAVIAPNRVQQVEVRQSPERLRQCLHAVARVQQRQVKALAVVADQPVSGRQALRESGQQCRFTAETG